MNFEDLQAYSDLNETEEPMKMLIKHFHLFNSYMIWPDKLPPIKRSGLETDTIRNQFISIYLELVRQNGLTRLQLEVLVSSWRK